MDTKLREFFTLDLEARGDVWDTPPSLSFLYDEDGWRLSRMPLPDQMWSHPHPSAVLQQIAEGFAHFFPSGLPTVRPSSWRGIAFFSESWLVIQEKNPDEEKIEIDPVLNAMAEARMLNSHPARIESRCWWVALSDGTMLSVVQRRDTGETESMFQGRDVTAEGRIPESLSTMVKILAKS